MLYICGQLTKILVPATLTQKLQRMEAGLVQAAIKSEVGACLHDITVQEIGRGRLRLTLRSETPAERQERIQRNLQKVGLRLTPEAAELMWDKEDVEDIVISKTLEATPRIILVHDSLVRPDNGYSVRWEDIREDWTFGNGVTCNSGIILKDGTFVPASWCVLLTDVGNRIHRDLPAMHALEQCFTG